MYEVFEKLLKRDGIKAADFSRATGISEATISTWKKRNAISTKHLKTVAEYFKVPLNVFFGIPENSQLFELTAQDTALLVMFKDLNELGKRKVMEYTSDLYDRYKNV